MALEPCRVCGALNSTETEICLSCEFPTKGRRRPAIFQWAAMGVVIVLTIPLLMVLFHRVKPKPPPQLPTSASAQRILNHYTLMTGE
jgi:hypothetical protein